MLKSIKVAAQADKKCLCDALVQKHSKLKSKIIHQRTSKTKKEQTKKTTNGFDYDLGYGGSGITNIIVLLIVTGNMNCISAVRQTSIIVERYENGIKQALRHQCLTVIT